MKPEKVIFVDEELEKAFAKLSEDDPLKKSITQAIKDLQQNAFYGRNVKKKLIPKELKKKYGFNNLWIYNLPNAWRLLYSITRSEDIKIIAAILDWMNHKDYERLFNFS
ncbi:hypothetical protein CMI48_03935 [Candidatus Pacearchaeota archaeon]|nr:hypothetical protein [Candidatus Pacearchaeota archaeon]|tara:strand:- start:58 stop:384 length:327 start_codon:yes stop_codon:yes gene_type:complete